MRKNFFSRTAITLALITAMIIPASATCSGGATVNGTDVNFRASASTSSAIKAVTTKGSSVIVESKADSTWYKVIYNGVEGYISSRYLTCSDSIDGNFGTAYINGTGVRLRSGASTSSSILGTYNTGTSLSVTGVTGNWYKVTMSGVSGYVCGDYVTFSKSAANTVTVSAGDAIVNTALQYKGYRYVYGGSSPSGFDCSGFVKYVYAQNGYTLDRTAAQQSLNGVAVDRANIQPGDILCFSSGNGYIGHVGIYIGNDQFIHASSSTTGVIITGLSTTSYNNRVAAIRRIV